MIHFDELLQIVDELTDEQIHQLQLKLAQRQQAFYLGDLEAIVDDFRQGLSQTDLDEMFEAMNEGCDHFQPLGLN